MRARDLDATRAVRSLLGAIDNAGAVEVTHEPTSTGSAAIAGATPGAGSSEADRREVDADGVAAIVAGHLQELRDAAARYRDAGDAERAEAVARELAALERSIGS